VTVSERDGDPGLSAELFKRLFDELSTWGRWGEDDERGALHHLTPERVAAAAAPVREGVTVTLSLPLNTESGIHNPEPAACESRGRWEFMFAAAPLRIVRGTGSPVNPLAIF